MSSMSQDVSDGELGMEMSPVSVDIAVTATADPSLACCSPLLALYFFAWVLLLLLSNVLSFQPEEFPLVFLVGQVCYQ